MPIKFIKGDLLASGADIIAHGCNCVGGFGSGVAGQIAQRYPHIKKAYIHKFNTEGWELGDVQFVRIGHSEKSIANCATQKEYYPRDRVHADYESIEKCMNIVKELAGDKTIAIPKIGCGLAGGDWEVVEKILNKVFDSREIWVYTL